MISRMKPVRGYMLLQILMYSWNIRKLLRLMKKARAVAGENVVQLEGSPLSVHEQSGSDSELSGSECNAEISSGSESDQISDSPSSGSGIYILPTLSVLDDNRRH
jgi:hypothetical protein